MRTTILSAKPWVTGGVACVMLFTSAIHVRAASVVKTLTDQSSMASFELADTGDPDGRGQILWLVDGVAHLFQQWFWYRIGRDDPEQSIDNLHLISHATHDLNSDGDHELMVVSYAEDTDPNNSRFLVNLIFRLDGTLFGSAMADLTETVRVINTSNDTLDFHLFQYVDFDLGDTPDNDNVNMVSPNTVRQTDATSNLAVVETVTSPAAASHELGAFSATRDKLDNAQSDNLDNLLNNLDNVNATWSFQWDFTIPAGGQKVVNKGKALHFVVIPTPMAAVPALAMLSGLAVLFRRNRKSARASRV